MNNSKELNTSYIPSEILRDPHTLQSKWIWTSDAPSEGQWINLRKTFTLSALPKSATARISVDSRYWLWINGEMAVYEGQLKMGPDQHSRYYDKVDLTPYLKKGENTVAVLACYWGFRSASAVPAPTQGFTFDAELSDGSRVVSDETWKARKDLAFEAPPFRKNKRPDAVDVKYNAAAAIEGWQAEGFDDSSWENASVKELSASDSRNVLVERSIPQWKVEDIVKYPRSELSVTERDNGNVTYSFHNSTNMQGVPYLKVNSAKGGETVRITTDATSHDGGETVTYSYVTKEGVQEWEGYNWTSGWKIDFTAPADVEIIELGWRRSGYATEHTGRVETSCEKLNQLYREAYDTLLITMRDIYMDCPDRERTQWWGDAVLEMQQAAYAMDENARLLYKKLLTQVIGWAEGRDGSLPTTPTNPTYMELHAQCVTGVFSLWQYYMYYGETDILELCYEPFLKFLKLWRISSRGYVTHRTGTSDWIDWGGNVDAAISDHCWYYLAAQNMKNVAEVLGKPKEDIDYLQSRVDLIKNSFDVMFWNEKLGAYYSATSSGRPDERAQAMAIYSGLADPARYPRLRDAIVSTKKASPYMEKYVLEALYIMGCADDAVNRMLDRYSIMLEDEHPTLYEDFDVEKLSGNKGTATRNHAWSGGPLSLMYMYTAGILPTSPAFKTVSIRPCLGALTRVYGTTDTACGTVTVETTASRMAVTVPVGCDAALICVPKIEKGATLVKLDGKVIYCGGKQGELPSGVSFLGEDDGYVSFNVPSGSYVFTMEKDAEASSEKAKAKLDGGRKSAYAHRVVINDCKDLTTASPLKGMFYAYRIYVNGEQISMDQYVRDAMLPIPYMVAAEDGEKITVSVSPIDPLNYEVYLDGGSHGKATELTFTVNSDITVNVTVKQRDTVKILPIARLESNSSYATDGLWGLNSIADGSRLSIWAATGGWGAAIGYGSKGYSCDTPKEPVTVTADLGEIKTFNQVSLFPRTGYTAAAGGARCFPKDFTLSVSQDGASYTDVAVITDHPDPMVYQQTFNFDTAEARYVKLTVTRLGTPDFHLDVETRHRVQLAEMEIALVTTALD